MAKGIDISYHQGSIDFNSVKNAGIEFVILREGYRTTMDKRFLEYAGECKRVGLPIPAVYHFSYALTEEEAKNEADVCIKNMKSANLGSDVQVFFDFEYDTVTQAKNKGVTLTPDHCNRHTIAFCEEVKRLGYVPGIYTNIDYHKNWYRDDVLNQYSIWLADYSGEPNYPCQIRQYSSKGSVPGIKGSVDMNEIFANIQNQPSTPSKDVDTLAIEVLLGLWGNGNSRRISITNAGYNYEDVQKRVNEIIRLFSGLKKYELIANLNIRSDAGTNNPIIYTAPNRSEFVSGGKSKLVGGTCWMHGGVLVKGKLYSGWCSSKYLRQKD